ncbi:hypothetical protein P4475_12085 [Halalkalibacterium halodurans]|uniref:hypothetical protein n=1 Tax=Halalkalibacterium halodurans TaxID=86665 RepID=UPI001068B0B8|nr:hypothetical protein [Halalkalibacterium halodurans]MED3647523.1 hypothetical protein [Halalkalibacterium halodurans]TES45747.1 hypothetical protein E2L07_20280 [Halalkalibacterium halodurans]
MRQRCGIMVSDIQTWKIWIGQQKYDAYEGMVLKIKIQNRYYQACLGKDQHEWFVTIEHDVTFNLRIFEVYKVQIASVDLNPNV